MKPLAIASSGVGKGLRGRDNGGDLTNVQYKPIWNCDNESPLYNESILIKLILKIKAQIKLKFKDFYMVLGRSSK
jgi:hypothetical protein